MKKNLLTIMLLIGIPMFSFSQLRVDSLGRTFAIKGVTVGSVLPEDHVGLSVQYSKNETTPYIGIKSTLIKNGYMPTNHIYAVCGIAKHQINSGVQNYGLRSVGVFGAALHSTSFSQNFSAGVAGVASVYGGVGVYGKVYPNNDAFAALPTVSSGSYAGYFDGSVKVTGAFYANTMTQTSDERLKSDISPLDGASSNDVLRLEPVTYRYTKDSLYYCYDDDAEAMTRAHYGLVAQQVKDIFPNLVYEDANGYLSVNYIEIIPLLIQTIKHQEERIANLEKSSNAMQRVPVNDDEKSVIDESAELYQNTPNPFSESTVIRFSLPQTINTATIYIYDMQGVQLQKHEIQARGDGSLTIGGGSLKAGMYLYALIADGKVIGTKRMILTE